VGFTAIESCCRR